MRKINSSTANKMMMRSFRWIVVLGALLILLAMLYKNKDNEGTIDRSRSTAKSNELVAFKNSLTCVQTPYDFRDADQEDPVLIEYIRSQLLVPPSVHKYSIENPDKVHFSQHSQSEIAKEFLGGMVSEIKPSFLRVLIIFGAFGFTRAHCYISSLFLLFC
ncbi:uncharacterized protein [Palaemon carinicauda]|uniref:uncharacterized protein n=1 Tax=Palaemon carinicauda TaxID=392227 RepID=UPI0035B643E1